MFPRLALICACACGNVAAPTSDATTDTTDAPGTPTTYRATMDVQPVTFGGKAAVGMAVYCMYKITLKQLDVELAILPSGQVASGRVQDLNHEEVIPSTTPVVCGPATGTIADNIATYTLTSASPAGTGLSLAFHAAATNQPTATLVGTLSSAGDGYIVTLSFHRTDALDAVLNWTVPAILTLSP